MGYELHVRIGMALDYLRRSPIICALICTAILACVAFALAAITS